MNNFIVILTFLYGIGGIVSFIGYFPTIKDLYTKKASANILTYLLWTITTFITSLYGIFILKDFVFNIIVNLQLLVCIIILFLSIKLIKK